MPLTAYTKFRFLWGAVSLDTDDEAPAYALSETAADIPAATNIRRCTLVWDRSAYSMDRVQTHLDFMNITGGLPDDTWTAGDFTTVEAAIDAFWGSIKSMYHTGIFLTELRWYRVGPGADPPEPTVRVSSRSVAGTSGTGSMPQQCAITVSLRTALRKHWGRIYLPTPTITQLAAGGLLSNTAVDAYGAAFNTLMTSIATADFYPVVYSRTKERAYSVNRVVVDNIIDIQRRRRPERSTYQKVYGA
jgi:hypothetical protein